MRPLLPLCAGGLVLALIACSAAEDPEDDKRFTEPLTIWADEDRALAMQTFAEAFTGASDRTMEVIMVEHEELRSSFMSTETGGIGPDILVGPHDWTGELAESGSIASVDLSEEDTDAFVAGALDAVTYDGLVYGIPYATENLALFRNTDLVPEAPDSMEELVEIGEDLVDSGAVEQVLSLQVGEEGDAYHIHPLFTSAGGYLFGEEESGNPDPTDLGVAAPESIEAFERLSELGEDGSGVLTRATDADNATDLFASGAAPFLVSGPWSVSTIQSAEIPYGLSSIPAFTDGDPARPLLGVQTFFIAEGTENPDLAADFARAFVSDPEFSVILHETDPRVPTLTTALDMLSEEHPDLQAFQRAGEGGLPMPAIPEMEAVWNPFSQAGADIIGGADPAEALSEAEQEIVAAFEE